MIRRIAISTGDGDTPGLNPVIRSLAPARYLEGQTWAAIVAGGAGLRNARRSPND